MHRYIGLHENHVITDKPQEAISPLSMQSYGIFNTFMSGVSLAVLPWHS